MLTKDVLDHYGSRANLAKKIGYSRQAVYRWGDLVPERAAFRIERETLGKFKVDESKYREQP